MNLVEAPSALPLREDYLYTVGTLENLVPGAVDDTKCYLCAALELDEDDSMSTPLVEPIYVHAKIATPHTPSPWALLELVPWHTIGGKLPDYGCGRHGGVP